MKTIKHLSLFLFCTSLLLLMGVSAYAAENSFLYPPDKSVISIAEIRIVGTTQDSEPKAQIILNGNPVSKDSSLTLEDHVFSKLLTLTPGNNTVSLLSGKKILTSIEIFLTKDMKLDSAKGTPFYLHSKDNLTGKCQDCHTIKGNGLKRYGYLDQKMSCITAACHQGFDTGKFKHGPFESGSCVECHNLHGSPNPFFLKKSGANLCFSCHTDAATMATEGKVVHFPVSKGDCTACHDPHKSDMEFHLKRGSMVELCAGCHGKTITEHEVLHDPVAEGDCNACHTPHTSNFSGLLYEDKKTICFTCHEVRKDEFKSTFVHEPLEKEGCTICHDPHGSASVFHLRTQKDENGAYVKVKQPIKELCLSCHRKLNPEIANQIEHGKFTHQPVADGKCTICHTPHSTNYKKQLNAPVSTLCFSCHKKMQKIIEGSLYRHGPVKTNDCALCHLVHGSNNKKLLRAKFSMKFSQKFKIENYALCFNCHSSKIVTDKNDLETEFRNGTRNLHYVHVNRKKKGRNCNTCHDIHASDQEKHIRKKLPFKKKFTIKIKFSKTATGGGCVVGCHKPRKYDRLNKIKNK